MAEREAEEYVFIVHFNPLELYPPVMNVIHYFENSLKQKKIVVLTTAAADSLARFKPGKSDTKIIRLGKTGKHISGFVRLLSYLHFYGTGLLQLIVKRPAVVLYFETFSSFSPIWYKKYFNRKAKIYIHYHEYMSLQEYREGRQLVRRLHKLEQKIYPEASWVSHTNEKRMELFLEDNKDIKFSYTQTIPNYPPGAWANQARIAGNVSNVVKIVYAGALNMDNMYTREFALWVQKQNGKVTWDVYSLNMDKPAAEFLEALNCHHIRVFPAIYYYELPEKLRNYDVGVILYKGASDNHTYSVSNKFFEYHVCGLDIWFPEEIVTSLTFVTHETYPKIIALNYSAIEQMNCNELTNRAGLHYKQYAFKCEEALAPLAKKLMAGTMAVRQTK